MEYKVTSIDQLKLMASGEIVKLPPFVQGQEFYARLRRPSLMKLVKSDSFPNSLLRTANTLFDGETSRELDKDDSFMKDMLDLLELFAESVFVEPTWQDLKNNGIELTDEQYMFIFNYAQRGVQALEPFREVEEDNQPSTDSAVIPMQTI